MHYKLIFALSDKGWYELEATSLAITERVSDRFT